MYKTKMSHTFICAYNIMTIKIKQIRTSADLFLILTWLYTIPTKSWP